MSGDPSRKAEAGSGAEAPRTRRSSVRRRLLAPLLILGGALVLGGCNRPTFFAFRGATVQGHEIFKLWSGMMIAGIIVAVIVWALIFWAVFRYRRRRMGPEIPRQFHSNILLEIIYTALPILIVGGIYYFTVVTENEVDAVSKTPAEIVHVVAYRWGWRFSYYSGSGQNQHLLIQTQGTPRSVPLPATSSAYPQLVLPVDSTVRIDLTSADVVHEMWVPEFDFGRYAQPGHPNTWDFTPTTTGVFRGQCAEYCGLYHAEMLFSVRVEPKAQFQQWLSSHSGQQSGALS
jgi:cytochrome c oxidase subunit 2